MMNVHTSKQFLQDQQRLRKFKIFIHLEYGVTYEGYSNIDLEDREIYSESAFTTGLSGYEETITDPSFCGQNIIFTHSHIGTYDTQINVKQSQKTHATAVIARNITPSEFIKKLMDQNFPLISGVDTRKMTREMVRNPGSHKTIISNDPNFPKHISEIQLRTDELKDVSITEIKWHHQGENPIVLIDYGVKNAIIMQLKNLSIPFVQVPYNTAFETIFHLAPSLVFLSNGPGDPRNYKEQIKTVEEILKHKIPIRGICLGHQLLSLAYGLKIIKLPFGQRGTNHPVFNRIKNSVVITSQNHGYAIEHESFNQLSKELNLFATEYSLFDHSIEAISSLDHLNKSVQYHPESNPGPHDAHDFFLEIKTYLEELKNKNIKRINETEFSPYRPISSRKYKKSPFKKILLVGSGPIKIGQASEFDYSGTQALKALKEEGIEVVLLNSNPATIMTDPSMCSKTYIEPITKDTIKKIIKSEKIDAVLSTMGGQTALNICVELEEEEKYFSLNNIALLGANTETIKKTEDRSLFAKELAKLGYQTGKRFTAHSSEEALTLANLKVGFPLIIRRDFALGGKGAALIYTSLELEEILQSDLNFPVTLEKSLVGQKEVEMEVMVDSDKNGVIICSIENVDPCGVHTGDSITVAPALTISDYCLQKLRTMSLTIAKHMGVVAGGANVQFAINPLDEDDITVIEMNPRVSRSSALASKATGYPIAKISALLSIGYKLHEVINDITKTTPVSFEPTLDYVAVKIPIFPFHKFPQSSKTLGPQMRSVGEVLALGSNFNEAFFKALRSLEMGLEIPTLSQLKDAPIKLTKTYLEKRLQTPQELSLLTALESLRQDFTTEEIFKHSKITPWFINELKKFVELEIVLKKAKNLNTSTILDAKLNGFSDKYIALLTRRPQKEILNFRLQEKITPVFKAVDTCSAEFIADTPYFYSTYMTENESIIQNNKEKIIVIGSGPNRIGQGIEFDYSCVNSVEAIRETNRMAIMINSNPETVSTDYDTSDRLYLSALYPEDVFDIILNEKPYGVISSFSGQTGIHLRNRIENTYRKEIFPTHFLGIKNQVLNLTEDRFLFSEFLKNIDIQKTQSKEVKGFQELLNAIAEIGFPVIIRPSFVIGGESMFIFQSKDDLNDLPESMLIELKNSETTFLVETYLENAIEYDVDMIRDEFGNLIYTVCEHIEYAGVHSGDSGMITPPLQDEQVLEKLKSTSIEMIQKLQIIGPINFQFATKNQNIYCIEANPRGSRTLPFLSKAYHLKLPKIATMAMLGEKIENNTNLAINTFAVKQSTFPFDRFLSDTHLLGPKMRSTGETMGIDRNLYHALLKSYRGNYPKLGSVGKILFSLSDETKQTILPFLTDLKKLGYEFLATPGTAKYIAEHGHICTEVGHIYEKSPNLVDSMKKDDMVLVINTPMNKESSRQDGERIRNLATSNGVPCFTRTENIKSILSALTKSKTEQCEPLALQNIN